MVVIAHRGNLNGPNPALENNPGQIRKLCDQGIQVEIDVRYADGKLWFGHDRPQAPAVRGLLLAPGAWCHAKDLAALHELLNLGAHCFYHDRDDCALTSRGFVWTHYQTDLTNQPLDRVVLVLPELSLANQDLIRHCHGICTDFHR